MRNWYVNANLFDYIIIVVYLIFFISFSGDELVLTELLFNGVFNDLTIAQCVALCSCFVVTENVKEDMPKLTQDLAGPYKIMQVIY